MKKRFLLMGAAAVLVMATVVGGSLAAGQVSGDQAVKAPLAALEVRVALNGDGGSESSASGDMNVPMDKKYMPGDTIPLTTDGKAGIYSVTNNGTVDAYIRVAIDKYWGEDWDVLDANELRPQLASDKWILADALFEDGSGEHYVYYYTQPVPVGGSTEPLLNGIELSAQLGNDFADKDIQIHASAQAVQFAGAGYAQLNQDGILSSWGVLATLDGSGNITDIQE